MLTIKTYRYQISNYNHAFYEKNILERTIQYIKDKTESFGDHYPSGLKNCKLNHSKNWLNLFIYNHKKELENTEADRSENHKDLYFYDEYFKE